VNVKVNETFDKEIFLSAYRQSVERWCSFRAFVVCNLFTERPGYRLSVHEHIDVMSLVKSFIVGTPYRLLVVLLLKQNAFVRLRQRVRPC
jgi:hypothetical protein